MKISNKFKKIYLYFLYLYTYKYRKLKIKTISRGNDNKIIKRKIIGGKLKIVFAGSHNLVKIEEGCMVLGNNRFYISGDNNSVEIKRGVTITGDLDIVVSEGTKVVIEEDCMIAEHVRIRTSDQHPIYDNKGIRINPASDVKIGPHVWLAQKVTIMKGCEVGKGSVVGYGSLVTKSIRNYTLAAGVPAKELKSDIHWERV